MSTDEDVPGDGLVHVRGHTRSGSGGTVDVSAYDRSPPDRLAEAVRLGRSTPTQRSATQLPKRNGARSTPITVTANSIRLEAAKAPSADINSEWGR